MFSRILLLSLFSTFIVGESNEIKQHLHHEIKPFHHEIKPVHHESCLADDNASYCTIDCCIPCGHFLFAADFLWWRAENHGFSYAFNQTENNTSFPNVGKVLRIPPKWDPGFRVGAGWSFSNGSWELFTNWTWYKNFAHTTKHLDNLPALNVGQGLYPMWPVARTVAEGTDLGPYSNASASWNLHHNAVDVECGKEICVSKRLLIKPNWGVRTAWLNQNFRSHLSDSVIPGQIPEFTFKGKNHYWGAGPRIGALAEWRLSSGLGLIGKAEGALLYGQTHVKNLSRGPSATTGIIETHHLFNEHFGQLVPNLQMMLGIEWGSCMFSDRFIVISACWEANYYWNQFNIPVSFEGYAAPMPTVGNQPLTMEGLTVNIRVDF